MKIALAQLNLTIGDFQKNLNRIVKFAEDARKQDCDLVVFSELALSGYPPRDLLEKDDFVEANLDCLQQLIKTIRGIGVICGYVDRNPENEGNALHNAAVVFKDGKMLHRSIKQLLPTYDVFDESRYFEPGTECKTFEFKGQRIGLTICEDAWNDKDLFKQRIYHTDPVDQMITDGAGLLINISASPFHVGKIAFRKKMHATISKKYKVPYIFVNQVGGNDSVVFDGTSTAFDSAGRTIARAKSFQEDMVIADTQNNTGTVRELSDNDEANIFAALVMGTRDYVTKCGFSRVVIGLSGGIDSALTAAVAVQALGGENVATVFMPSAYTSKDNYEDTRQLADNLRVSYDIIPIDDIFKTFLEFLAPSFEAGDPGVTEQNIQARVRGTILMGISNRSGALVLSTGNKSELAVGYCTLYGDMNGGLAVISDVPKTVVYDLARYINTDREIIPTRIVTKAPSAELKPDQLDQDDLPPYEVLDMILKAYVEENRGLEDIVAMGLERRLVQDVIARVDRNEYKRHQAAPGLKVTSKAFGYGRRYPLAQRYSPARDT